MIVLVGFMGAGKSSVGPLLAERMSVPFLDSDDIVARRAGAPIEQIFATAGEDVFRDLEREVVAEVLTGADGVVALGGGAPADPVTRAALKGVSVVYLHVDLDEALRRIGDPSSRPVLAAGDAPSLFAARDELYQQICDVRIDTTRRTPEEVVALIVEATTSVATAPDEPETVWVDLGARRYPVVVGRGVIARLSSHVELPADAERAVVVTHPNLTRFAAPALASLEGAGLAVDVVEVDEGEGSKSWSAAGELLEEFARRELHRHDLVVAVGGGVITDLVGFAASLYQRGIAVVHAPSTLLGQVDAAIGGKTGVNLEAGKNLVGTFYQPLGVLCDLELLDELPEAEFRSGLAEVVKYGFLFDPYLLEVIEGPDDLVARDRELLGEVVARCVRHKADVVAADERDAGRRALLNYGHTFGHAIETAVGYGGIRHGEAVSLGMVCAALTARELGRVNDACVDRHRAVLSAAGLPIEADLDFERMQVAWSHDKKYRRGVRFVLLVQPDGMDDETKAAGLGVPEAGIAVPDDVLERAIKGLS